MKLKLPLVNKVKHILPMFSGEFQVDIVGVKDDVIVSISDVTGDSNNEILYIGWNGDGGKFYNMKCTEGNVSKSRLINHTLVMTDHEGDEVTLRFS